MLCRSQHLSDQVTSPSSPAHCSGIFQETLLKANLLPPFLHWMVSATRSYCYSAAGHTALAQRQFEEHVDWKGPQGFT